jgi:hypothetical protein
MAVIPFPNPLEMHRKSTLDAPRKASAHPVDLPWQNGPGLRQGLPNSPE